MTVLPVQRLLLITEQVAIALSQHLRLCLSRPVRGSYPVAPVVVKDTQRLPVVVLVVEGDTEQPNVGSQVENESRVLPPGNATSSECPVVLGAVFHRW